MEDRLQRALKHISRFVEQVGVLISSITIEDLIEKGGLNPYIVAALQVNSFREIAELFVYRRVERSLGTSFGFTMEAFLRELLGGIRGREHRLCREGRGWICWWDIVIDREFREGEATWKGKVLSVKSGPADVNKDIVERFVEHAKEAIDNGYRPYLVLTYGKRAFAVAESTLESHGYDPEEYLRVGRGVFKEFLGNPDLYDTIIDAMRGVGGVDIFDMLERKVDELAKKLEERYGGDVVKFLRSLS
ncbi:hypothetical protein IG193_09040 [Infirmifilum lucidum]|uniref:Type II restriction endonuclease EcoO109IR domain-containing protein n=1 Tax=Infirmifilum lucidum TaxID=2776706 RepID=A0A7L9FHN5_9CREN|nr:hypothetical protein [Infirmifilum lucidum]QOJ78872.1 hypothetical protein IG193_09040 [Infirmifilum lucidum]